MKKWLFMTLACTQLHATHYEIDVVLEEGQAVPLQIEVTGDVLTYEEGMFTPLRRLYARAQGDLFEVSLDGYTWYAFEELFTGTAGVSLGDDNTARIWDAGSGAQLAVLSGHDGNVAAAARLAGISRPNFHKKLKTLGIDPARFKQAARRGRSAD